MAKTDNDLSDDALYAHLNAEANERGQRLSIRERDGGWRAAFLGTSGFGGDIVSLSTNGPDRRAAMVQLAILVEQNI